MFPPARCRSNLLCQSFRDAADLNALAVLGPLRFVIPGPTVGSNPPLEKTMATKAHHCSRNSRHRISKTLAGQWLVALLARTLANVLLMIVARWLHLTVPGGE
jgi:hypothetical protein